jgi:ATP phosphoribosyltransferase
VKLLGIPSASSKFNGAALEVLARGLGADLAPAPPSLRRRAGDCEIVGARGRDLPRLVGLGLVDAALTGLDAYLEATLDGHQLAAWGISSSRPSRLCLMASRRRRPDSFERILSEYPLLTTAWLAAQNCGGRTEVIQMRGSIEGLVSCREGLGGVATVVSGETMRANGLVSCGALLDSDMCLVTRPGDSDWVERFGAVLRGPAAAPGWAAPGAKRPGAAEASKTWPRIPGS